MFTDNQNVVRIIQVHVGSRVRELQVLAIELFSLALANQVIIEPEWIPRAENELADYVSDYNDWMVNPNVFAVIDCKWEPHTIDRFADSYNTQLLRFNSRFWVTGSEAVDAFTVNWHGEVNWVFPLSI